MSETSKKNIETAQGCWENIVKALSGIAGNMDKCGALIKDINDNSVYSDEYKSELVEKYNKAASESVIASIFAISKELDTIKVATNEINGATDILDDGKLTGALLAIKGVKNDETGAIATRAIVSQFKGDFASLNLLAATTDAENSKAMIYKCYLSDESYDERREHTDGILDKLADNANAGKYKAVSVCLYELTTYLASFASFFDYDLAAAVNKSEKLTGYLGNATELRMREAMGL